MLGLLERVGHARLERGDARGALQLAEQAITLDGLHEPSWRLVRCSSSHSGAPLPSGSGRIRDMATEPASFR